MPGKRWQPRYVLDSLGPDLLPKLNAIFQDLALYLDGKVGKLKPAEVEDAVEGTRIYRSVGAPTAAPEPTGITQAHLSNGTMALTLGWAKYTQGEVPADLLLIFYKWAEGADPGTPDVTSACLAVSPNTEAAGTYTFNGLNPANHWSFAIAAARKTESGLEIGSLQTDPLWTNVTIGTPNFQGTIGGTAASEVADATGNFNYRNDRKATEPADPVIAPDGTAIDHVLNDDASATISFEWAFSGVGDAADIDGFNVYLHVSDTDTPYVFGTDPSSETVYRMPYTSRAFTLDGVAPNKYYTFGVQAYRNVDQDIDLDGVKVSAIVQPSNALENPYRPSSNVAFSGEITGTIGGVSAEDIADATTNFDTRNDRKSAVPAVPTFAVDGSAVEHVSNSDASVDIILTWDFTGTGDAYDVDGFIVYHRASSSPDAYTFGTKPVEEHVAYVPKATRTHIFQGVAADKYHTFGVRAYRDVDQDIEADGRLQSAIVKPSGTGEDPYRPSENVNFTGLIDGTAASMLAKTVGFGDGSDGALNTAGNVTFPVAVDGEPVIKRYTSITINAGHTVTVSNRCKGLILQCQGDCVINGAIRMDGKAAYVGTGTAGGTNPSFALFSLVSNAFCYMLIPFGGAGGNGGSGGAGGLPGGLGGVNSAFGGSGGGGGGGGGIRTYSSTPYSGGSGGKGAGNGGDGGLGALTSIAPDGPREATEGKDGQFGGGGGILAIVAGGNITIGSTGVVSASAEADGANGWDGDSDDLDVVRGGGGGGGGGAGGGIVVLAHQGTYSNSGSVVVDGSNGGSGGAYGGSAGGNGQVGSIMVVQL